MKTLYGFDAPDDYASPQWDKAGKTHEWKNYVGEHVKRLWGTFTDEQKAAIAAGAEEAAGREEWD